MDVLLVMNDNGEKVHLLVRMRRKGLVSRVLRLVEAERKDEAVDVVIKYGQFRDYLPCGRINSEDADLILRGPVTKGET